VRLNILIVDDEELVGMSVARLLQARGHTVDVATKAMTGFSKASKKIDHYHVVITDNRMPGVTGVEMIRALRAAGYKGRILAFSGNVSPEARLIFVKAGTDAIFQKPVDLAKLQEAVRKIGWEMDSRNAPKN
jgi:DNA-binding response OmpR family regulator